MKKNNISKLILFLGLFCTTFTLPLASCSSFFADEGFSITDISWQTNETNGNTQIVIETTKETDSTFTVDIPAVGIKNIEAKQNDEKTELKITIYYTDPSKPETTFTIPIIKGKDGKGIKEVKVSKDSNDNILLTFVYTDDTLSETITIPKGEDGNSIKEIKSDEISDPDFIILTIIFTDNTEPKEIKIAKPKNGISIINTVYNAEESNDNVYTITITYSDGFTENVSFPRPKGTIWHHGEGAPDSGVGKNGDYYMNVVSGYIYFKENGTWKFIFSMDGSGSYVEKIVTFHAGEGLWVDPQLINGASYKVVVEYGKYIELNKFPEINRVGYTFAGWYTSVNDSVNSGHFTDLTPVLKNMDLFPRWN